MSNHKALEMFGRSGNPSLSADTFSSSAADASFVTSAPPATMTLQGTVNKTAMLLALVVISASYTWAMFFSSGNPAKVIPWAVGGAIAGLVLALITMFKKQYSGITAPLYAIAEGLFLGAISAVFEAQYPGIVIQAVGGTFGTLAALLLCYQSGLIRATENFKLGIVAATGGIFFVYLISMIGGMFGFPIPFIHEAGPLGIGFSVVVVIIAALNLVLDFDFIETAANRGAPKYLEWYGAFALMVTLVWLYLEILRLLSKLNSRD